MPAAEKCGNITKVLHTLYVVAPWHRYVCGWMMGICLHIHMYVCMNVNTHIFTYICVYFMYLFSSVWQTTEVECHSTCWCYYFAIKASNGLTCSQTPKWGMIEKNQEWKKITKSHENKVKKKFNKIKGNKGLELWEKISNKHSFAYSYVPNKMFYNNACICM